MYTRFEVIWQSRGQFGPVHGKKRETVSGKGKGKGKGKGREGEGREGEGIFQRKLT